MKVSIHEGGNKIQLLYVLWVLENYSDKNTTLKQEEIVKILKRYGYHTDRRSVGRDLKLLYDFGYNVHGVEPELDENGNELPIKRGKIWLEREIADERLTWRINSVKFNVYMDKEVKKDLIDSIISLGSKTFKEKNSVKTILVDKGLMHIEGASIFHQLNVINNAICQKEPRRIRFKYSQLERKGDKYVYSNYKEYVVSPYWIIPQNGNTYLVCYNHAENKIWHCRVEKMKEVEVIKTYALPINDTPLKGVAIEDYVRKHPLMFSGEMVTAEIKINKKSINRIVETFGDDLDYIDEDEDHITLRICAGEQDIFYWAIQFGQIVEVLSPQTLRDRIRYHVEGLALKYVQYDGDKYSEAIKATKNNGDLDLRGIVLGSKNKHTTLTSLKTLKLSDNKISDISFVEKYKNLNIISLANNPIRDLSPLENLDNVHTVSLENIPVEDLTPLTKMKNLKYLSLSLGRDVDYKVINDIKNLKTLSLPETDSYHLDWGYIEKHNPELEVRTTKYRPKEEAKRGGCTTSPYPLILFKEALGYNIVLTCDNKTATNLADNLLKKLCGEEKKVATYFYKKGYNEQAISEDMSISTEEVERVLSAVKEKITHVSYNGEMENFVAIDKPNSTNAIEKLYEIVGLKKR